VSEIQKKLKVKIEKKPHCLIELEIISPSEIVKKAQNEGLKEVNKEVSIPGFRKGKAPDDLILKKYPSFVKEKLEKKIADLSLIEANKEEKLPELSPSTKITFKIKDYSLETGATINYTYETEPVMPEIDPNTLKIKTLKKKEVTQEQIDETIRQARFFYAKWKEVQRPIEEGDYIIIDLDSLETDPPSKVFDSTRFEVSDKGMANWMKKLVISAKANDTIEGISEADETATDEEKEKFQPKKVLITIKKVEEATLPDLDDEFAKKLGVKNVEELQTYLKDMLEKEAEAKHSEENRKLVHEFLLNKYKFDLPLSLVTEEIEYRRSQFFKNPDFKKTFDKMTASEKKDFENDLQKYSENAIRIFYISKKIIADLKIKISKEEIEQTASDIYYSQTGKHIDSKAISPQIYALAFSRLVLTKTEDYILDQSSKT